MVDEKPGCNFSIFYDTKSGMVGPTYAQFESGDKPTSLTRYARENNKLQARSDQVAWKLNAEFEYMAKNALQQNHFAKLGFTIIAPKARLIQA